MRILFLNHNLREHGTYFRALHIAREMVRLGHQATLWTASPEHWYRAAADLVDGVRIVETPSRPWGVGPDDGWSPVDIAWRAGHVLAEPCDLVYAFAHPPSVYLPARLAQVLRRKPLVVDWCDAYRDGILPLRAALRRQAARPAGRRQRMAERIEARYLERRIVRRADAVTVISRGLEDAALAEGVARERLLRLPSGAPIGAIEPLERELCRRALGIAREGPLLGFVTNYHPDEAFFLAALEVAFARAPEAALAMAAPPFSEALVRRHGLEGRIVNLGRRPFSEIPTVLGAADVLALPLADTAHNRYRWPNKFGDYLAAGRPIAANAIGDVADYMARAEAAGCAVGRLAPADDATAYGEAMADLLNSPAEAKEMGQAARNLAEGELNWQRLGERVARFLARIAR